AGQVAAVTVDRVDVLVGSPEDDVELAVAVEVGERRTRIDLAIGLAVVRRRMLGDPVRKPLQQAAVAVPGVDAAVKAGGDDLAPAAASNVPDRGRADEAAPHRDAEVLRGLS